MGLHPCPPVNLSFLFHLIYPRRLGILVFTYTITKTLGGIYATRLIHADLVRNVLGLPMSFFDTTPVGRMVNRFSKDVDVMDSKIPGAMGALLTNILKVTSTLIVITMASPMFLVCVLPIAIFYKFIQVPAGRPKG